MSDHALRPAFATIPDWQKISGMSRSGTYEALARGSLIAVKQGKRTLINVEHGLGYLHALPPAKIGKAA